MLSAMLYKEVRETAAIVAVALAFYFYFDVKAMRHDLLPGLSTAEKGYMPYEYAQYFFEIPFVGRRHLAEIAWVSAGLTIALGLWQSAGESIFGTWLFQLHRPVARARLSGVKLLGGATLPGAWAAAAIRAYACWAAAPGTHASPFEWSMTVPAWKVWITMPLVYFGAFLSGIRPARWVGTRLLPLAAAGFLAAIIPDLRWWPICGLGLIVLGSIVLVRSILSVARTRNF